MMRKIAALIMLILFSASAGAQDTLTLSQALSLTLENNFGIRIARLEAALASQNNSLGNAGFLPEVNVDLSQSYTTSNTYQKFFSGVEKEGNNANSNTFSGKVSLNWTLFDGFRMFITKDKLETLEKMGELNTRLTMENNLAAVILAYADLVEQQKILEVLQQAIRLSGQRMALAASKLQLGSGSELNLLQSQVDRNADSSLLLKQIVRIRNLKSDFNVLTGSDPSVLFEVENKMEPARDYSLDALTERMRTSNPELQMALAQQEIAYLEKKAANRNSYPTVTFTGGYNYNRSEYEIGILNYNKGYGPTYGLTATMNLFDGFNRKLERKNARVNAEIASTEKSQLELQLKSTLLKSYNSYVAAVSILKLEEQNVTVADKNLFVASENYKLGGISDIDLRITQQKLIEAESRLINARYQTKSLEVDLLLLTGGLGIREIK